MKKLKILCLSLLAFGLSSYAAHAATVDRIVQGMAGDDIKGTVSKELYFDGVTIWVLLASFCIAQGLVNLASQVAQAFGGVELGGPVGNAAFGTAAGLAGGAVAVTGKIGRKAKSLVKNAFKAKDSKMASSPSAGTRSFTETTPTSDQTPNGNNPPAGEKPAGGKPPTPSTPPTDGSGTPPPPPTDGSGTPPPPPTDGSGTPPPPPTDGSGTPPPPTDGSGATPMDTAANNATAADTSGGDTSARTAAALAAMTGVATAAVKKTGEAMGLSATNTASDTDASNQNTVPANDSAKARKPSTLEKVADIVGLSPEKVTATAAGVAGVAATANAGRSIAEELQEKVMGQARSQVLDELDRKIPPEVSKAVERQASANGTQPDSGTKVSEEVNRKVDEIKAAGSGSGSAAAAPAPDPYKGTPLEAGRPPENDIKPLQVEMPSQPAASPLNVEPPSSVKIMSGKAPESMKPPVSIPPWKKK